MDKMRKNFFKKDAYVYIEGDEDSNEIYLIEKGAVELTNENDKIKHFKSIIKEGEIFGFTSALSKRPRMDSAIARSDIILVTIERSKFIDLIQKNTDIALKIIRNFADELRAYDEMVISIEESETIGFTKDTKMFNLGIYYYKNSQYPIAHYILNRFTTIHSSSDKIDEARAILSEIEKSGFRKLEEGIRKGIYRLYTDKQPIFCEYEPGDDLFIIKEGKVKITKVSNNNELILSILKEGDIFGELAIVTDMPRNATAISWGKTSLMPINKDSLRLILSKAPNIILKIFMAISQRIWFTYIRLEAKLYTKPLTRFYAFLENKLLEERHSLKSTTAITLPFSIDDIIRMSGLTKTDKINYIEHLTQDKNFNFNFGNTTIENPSVLSAKAKFYRSRDHIPGADEEKELSSKSSDDAISVEIFSDGPESISSDDNSPFDELEDIESSSGPDTEDSHLPSDDIPFDLD